MQSQHFLAIVDKHLADWIDKGLNFSMKNIEPEMADPNQGSADEWKRWVPIQSKVTDVELDKLEKAIGYPLPESYRTFLKHKHFYELHIGEASFCSHVVNELQSSLTDLVFNSYPREFLIDKGYIPFADWSDWGMLCFDTHSSVDGYEYAVVLWDHESWDEFTPFAGDFVSLIMKLDQEAANNSE